ncbi:MAG: TetR/AcrR family transcriptional regulator [Saprospirales bacterium]|nr:TetR/AcrR family transcriptional regulator [Saprospirales bacterium]MBK8490671.1 TetR/AcrR family transcriptional regulator [Saprospirales bacterium]
METIDKILVKSEALFLRYGIRSITMDDIARELGISKKTLYHFVDNKADLIHKVLLQFIEEERRVILEITQSSGNAIEEMLRIGRYITQVLRKLTPTTLFDLQKYYPDSWQMIRALNQEHIYGVIKNNLEQGIEQELYRHNLNTDIIARLYVGKSHYLVDEEFFPLRNYERGQLYLEFILYHMHGILSDKGREWIRTNHCELSKSKN